MSASADPTPEPILPKRPLLRKFAEIALAVLLAFLGAKYGITPAPVNVQVVGPHGEPMVMQVSSPK